MIDITGIMAALARLKDIPIAKVLRNAARDYVQGAYKATPTAQISKSQYYVFTDWKTGKKHYLHESQVKTEQTKSGNAKMAQKWKNFNPARGFFGLNQFKLKKVRVAKGWSKATWAGVMRELGMATKAIPKRLPSVVADKSELAQNLNANAPKVTVSDEVRFDDFGKQSTAQKHTQIAQAGFALAAKRLVTEYARMLRRAW